MAPHSLRVHIKANAWFVNLCPPSRFSILHWLMVSGEIAVEQSHPPPYLPEGVADSSRHTSSYSDATGTRTRTRKQEKQRKDRYGRKTNTISPTLGTLVVGRTDHLGLQGWPKVRFYSRIVHVSLTRRFSQGILLHPMKMRPRLPYLLQIVSTKLVLPFPSHLPLLSVITNSSIGRIQCL